MLTVDIGVPSQDMVLMTGQSCPDSSGQLCFQGETRLPVASPGLELGSAGESQLNEGR